MFLRATKYRLQTSMLTGSVWKDLLQEKQLHNGNQHQPKIFERNIFWEKIQVELKQHNFQEISTALKSSRINFMTASHLDKAEKKELMLHYMNITQTGS